MSVVVSQKVNKDLKTTVLLFTYKNHRMFMVFSMALNQQSSYLTKTPLNDSFVIFLQMVTVVNTCDVYDGLQSLLKF